MESLFMCGNVSQGTKLVSLLYGKMTSTLLTPIALKSRPQPSSAAEFTASIMHENRKLSIIDLKICMLLHQMQAHLAFNQAILASTFEDYVAVLELFALLLNDFILWLIYWLL